MPICCTCKLDKPQDAFCKRKNPLIAPARCKECNAANCKEWRKKNPDYWKKMIGKKGTSTRQRYYDKRTKMFVKTHAHFLKQLLYRARWPNGRKKEPHEVHVDLAYILSIWDQQSGKCAITNLQMLHERNNPESVSIDRIDSSREYVEGNIQLVCRFVNLAKQHYSNERVKDLFQRMAISLREKSLGDEHCSNPQGSQERTPTRGDVLPLHQVPD